MKVSTLIFSLSALACLGFVPISCNKAPLGGKQMQEASKHLSSIVDGYFEACLQLNPLFATSIGDHRFDDKMTIPISAEYRKQDRRLCQDSLNAIKKIDSKSLQGQDLLTYETFIRDMETTLALQEVDISYLMPFNQLTSFFSDFAELASGSSFIVFNTEADYRNFLKRAAIVPSYIDVMIENMKIGMQRGITTPKILVEKGLKQLSALLVPDYTKSVFYQPVLTLDAKVSGPAQQEIKLAYDEMIKNTIYPSYHKLQEFVQKEYLPHARTTDGLCELPGGEAFYKALVRSNTTTDLTPLEVMELGHKEVERIRKEFIAAKEAMHFSGDLKAFFAFLKEKNPQFYPFHTDKEVIQRYWDIYHEVMGKVPEYFHLMPKAKFEIREVEAFKAENASEAYQNPSEDGSRPGIFWVPIPNPADYSAKDMESLFLHEAIPGHHFQISIQQELPLCRYRKFMGNTAYIEGWALYAESLGKDLGLYTDIIQWVGRLSLEMHRAIRLVVDTGLHWDGWSREKAIQYSLENEPTDHATIISEVDRYMVMPGQAVSYKVGELKIQDLKKRAQQELGKAYSDKEFHDQILENGSLPLAVLDRQVSEWIKKKSASL